MKHARLVQNNNERKLKFIIVLSLDIIDTNYAINLFKPRCCLQNRNSV